MADEFLTHALTWAVANGSSLGSAFLWLTKPLRVRLKSAEARLDTLEKSYPGAVTLAELTRRMCDLEAWRKAEETESLQALRRDTDEAKRLAYELQKTAKRLASELQRALKDVVSDEEFHGFIAVQNEKMDKLLETLGMIRGTLDQRRGER